MSTGEPVLAAVSTENPVKLRACEKVLGTIYSHVKVVPTGRPDGMPEEPMGAEVMRCAVRRARFAIATVKEAGLGIGIEAGIVENDGIEFDVQYCAVVDEEGQVTLGHGPGFVYPECILECVKKRGLPVGKCMEELTGIKDLGKSAGAVGYLSGGRISRQDITEAAVLMAMIPRISSHLYRSPSSAI